MPRDLPVMQVYARMKRTFPGGAGPAIVVVSARDVTQPRVTRALAELKRAALASGRMHDPIRLPRMTPDVAVEGTRLRSPSPSYACPRPSEARLRSAGMMSR